MFGSDALTCHLTGLIYDLNRFYRDLDNNNHTDPNEAMDQFQQILRHALKVSNEPIVENESSPQYLDDPPPQYTEEDEYPDSEFSGAD